jgi:hypothetical protein
MNDENHGATKLTGESWRPKFYGLINEGRKYRVSSTFVRHSAWVIGLSVVAVQVYSALQPSFKKSTVVLFAPPQVRADLDVTYVPPLMDAKRDAAMARDLKSSKARGRPVPIVERIKPVSLNGFQGIPPGSETVAQLVSGGANGMVKAQLTDILRAAGDVLLPRGTILIGKGSSSDDRLYILFRKAITPDGQASKINAQAYDEKDRIVGLKGKKISDYAFRLAASAGLIFLGGVADGMRDDYSQSPFVQRRPTMRDAALNGVSTSTADMSHQMIDSMKNAQERVVVDHSTKLIVIFGDADATE